MFRRLLRWNASLYGLVAKSEYDVVYGWYEEKRDECEQLKANVDDLLLESLTFEKNLEEADLLRQNAFAAYDQQVEKNTALREELEQERRSSFLLRQQALEANEMIEKLRLDYNFQLKRALEAEDTITAMQQTDIFEEYKRASREGRLVYTDDPPPRTYQPEPKPKRGRPRKNPAKV